MSLYLGSPDGNAMLHITNATNTANDMRSTTMLNSTVFHSRYSFAKTVLLERVVGTKYYTDYGSSQYDYIWYKATKSTTISKINDGTTMLFIVGKGFDGITYDPMLSTGFDKGPIQKLWGFAYTGSDSNEYGTFAGANIKEVSFGNLIYDYFNVYVNPGYLDIYEVTIENIPASGYISIMNGKIDIGGISVFASKFLNLGINNKYDKTYITKNRNAEYQIIGENSNGSVILKGNSVFTVSSTKNIEYNMFNIGGNCTTNILYTKVYSSTKSVIVTETKPGSLFICIITIGSYHEKFTFDIYTSNMSGTLGYDATDKTIKYDGTMDSVKIVELG